MMSMTGFGKVENSFDEFEVNVEVKSVNHRFKDYRFRMGQQLNALELDLRKILDSHFKRGSFDISIFYKKKLDTTNEYEFNKDYIQKFLLSFNDLIGENSTFTHPYQIQLNPIDFTKNEFLLDQDDDTKAKLYANVTQSFQECCERLKNSRHKEGTKLIDVLNNHLNEYEKILKLVNKEKEKFNPLIKERLTTKLKELDQEIKVDDQRFSQELVYYLEKMDIDEEINRATVHVERLFKILKQDISKQKGREIEFILQEIHRETNTMGSKASSTDLSKLVVDMKLHLEKMREQALNME